MMMWERTKTTNITTSYPYKSNSKTRDYKEFPTILSELKENTTFTE
jgi:hypothetical protein